VHPWPAGAHWWHAPGWIAVHSARHHGVIRGSDLSSTEDAGHGVARFLIDYFPNRNDVHWVSIRVVWPAVNSNMHASSV
jgi:hypothetical protein